MTSNINELFAVLLDPELYNKVRSSLYLENYSFPSELSPFRKVAIDLIETQKGDTPTFYKPSHLMVLFNKHSPVATESTKQSARRVVANIEETIAESTPESLVEAVYTQNRWAIREKLAETLFSGEELDYSWIEQQVSNLKHGVRSKGDSLSYVSKDIDELLDSVASSAKWKFHLKLMKNIVGGIGEETLTIVAAPPDTGKTACCLSFVFHPEGWLAQGAKVHYIANEENASITMQRGISCYTGKPRDELIKNPAAAQKKFDEIKDNITIINSVDLTLSDLDRYLYENKGNVDILIVDQLDKVQISGKRADDHHLLQQLYQGARELAKRHKIAVVSVSQAGAGAVGKLNWGYDDLANSKIGKAAEADVVIAIGCSEVGENDNGTRKLNFPKQKLTGNKESVICILNKSISRLED